VFTADYYVANPDAYLGKEVTLSVSSLNPRNEQPLLEAVARIATCGDLHHPKLHPTRFADHVLIPRRIPDELNIGFIDAVDRKDFALCIMRITRITQIDQLRNSNIEIRNNVSHKGHG